MDKDGLGDVCDLDIDDDGKMRVNKGLRLNCFIIFCMNNRFK